MSEVNPLAMSDADFLNAPMPDFKDEVSSEKQEEVQTITQEEEIVNTEEEIDTPVPEEDPSLEKPDSNIDVEVDGKPDTPEDPDKDTPPEDTDKDNPDKNETDYKGMVEKLLAPFKANGREIKVDNVDEAITLMQQGANYNKKMAGLKPSLKILKMLENNGLLDEGKLTYLIDIDKKNPDAIAKLIKESGIDPLDVNTQDEPKYTPGQYSVPDAQIVLDEVLDSIEHSPTYERTMDVILNQWDANSKRELANDPKLIPLIDVHMSNGIYDLIANELEKQKALGALNGLSDLQAYEAVGKQLAAKGAFNKPTNSPVEVKAKVPTQEDTERAAKRKAASPTKQSQKAKEQDFNPLAMSDEEFEKAFKSLR